MNGTEEISGRVVASAPWSRSPRSVSLAEGPWVSPFHSTKRKSLKNKSQPESLATNKEAKHLEERDEDGAEALPKTGERSGREEAYEGRATERLVGAPAAEGGHGEARW